jgi:hypothetical protein
MIHLVCRSIGQKTTLVTYSFLRRSLEREEDEKHGHESGDEGTSIYKERFHACTVARR